MIRRRTICPQQYPIWGYLFIIVFLFIVIGFATSWFLFLIWPFAPLCGWLYIRQLNGYWRTLFAASLGLFVGGLPMWLNTPWPDFVVVVPLLVLVSALAAKLIPTRRTCD